MSCNMCKCDTWLNQHIVDPLKTSEISKLLKNKFKRRNFRLKKFCATADWVDGGARRDRTADLLRARQALSQLSYGPMVYYIHLKIYLVGLGRFELPTSPLSGVRSNQLSYRPKNISECLVALRAKLGKFQGCCCYQITCEGTRIFVFWLLFAL